jgi:YHS domain-containing protein
MEYITVCESKVTAEEGQEIIRAEYKGQTYYFCEAACKEDFLKNPEIFLVEHKPKPPVIPFNNLSS